ncbi:MAG: DEAD/DEAH box helicase [Alphaproteobacteria bacterium]|nr:MAG: DEAD/DEAH box helicase [Alphaproteobacteria bacterium]
MADDFNGFGLPAKLMQALGRLEFLTPTPIQEQTIPLALSGRDVLGSAQTGTGKTLAFGIPLIVKLMEDPTASALVMTPTRELAGQVMLALQQLIPVSNIKTALLIGGDAMPRQFNQLQQKPRLIVGTPGRITDHLDRGSLKLDTVRFLVLDETDRMLDMGFGVQIDKILRYMTAERQTLLFSATMPAKIIKIADKYTKNPVRVAVGLSHAPVAKIKQDNIHTSDIDKYAQLLEQLQQRQGSIIIFVKTKYGADKLATRLNKSDHRSDAIHGNLQQRSRDRVIQSFRDKKYRILVATDIAARGLDIPHIEHVINYDMPQVPEDYIHRIGRTARAGAEGSAVNFLTPADGTKWKAIHRLLNGHEESAHKGAPKSGNPSANQARRKTFWKNKTAGGGQRHRGSYAA